MSLPLTDEQGRPVRADGSIISETAEAIRRREARVRGEPWLTEAEYAATLPERADRVVAEINERLADELPEGLRFEFEPLGTVLPDWKTSAHLRPARR